jgi:hypothetical protein
MSTSTAVASLAPVTGPAQRFPGAAVDANTSPATVLPWRARRSARTDKVRSRAAMTERQRAEQEALEAQRAAARQAARDTFLRRRRSPRRSHSRCSRSRRDAGVRHNSSGCSRQSCGTCWKSASSGAGACCPEAATSCAFTIRNWSQGWRTQSRWSSAVRACSRSRCGWTPAVAGGSSPSCGTDREPRQWPARGWSDRHQAGG